MNIDAVYRSLTDKELDGLERYMRHVRDHDHQLTPLEDPEAYRAFAKYHDLGGIEASQRAKAGTEPKQPTTIDEVYEHFNNDEMDLLQEATIAIRDKRPMTDAEEAQYA